MKAIAHDHKGHDRGAPEGRLVLTHDERTLRRRLLTLTDGREVLVDLPATVSFATGDVLVTEDGKIIEIIAAHEALYLVSGRDNKHLLELCWHIGNRHLPCEIRIAEGAPAGILIEKDRVIGEMLRGLGADVRELVAPFSPMGGAYGDHGDHHHHHGDGPHHHSHD